MGSIEDPEETIAGRMMEMDRDAAMHTAASWLVECELTYEFAHDLVTETYKDATTRDWVSWAVYEAQARLRDHPGDDWNDFETRTEWNDKEEEE